MPKFSDFFGLGLSQHQLDFVDVSTDYDTQVYVDPYAIEIRNDVWSANASEHIRTFFIEVLEALRAGDDDRAVNLMSHLNEPQETFLGVSSGKPRGRGVGRGQSDLLINAMKRSVAFETGLLSDLSEMALYVEGMDRDKVSDLTTNIIRDHLVDYTQQQCELYGIETLRYSGPPSWNLEHRNWVSNFVQLPHIEDQAVILVPKYIVRRQLSLNSQEFYNKQITDFLVAEHLKANSSLVQTIKGGKEKKVYKKDVRKAVPKSKNMIAQMVADNPDLLDTYKDIAKRTSFVTSFHDSQPSIHDVCRILIQEINDTPTGRENADRYHKVIMGVLTTLFYPDLIQPHKEWEIHDGRKRIDVVYTNAGDHGFFSQRRDAQNTQANMVIVECKNYTNDLANVELDQLLGRFDNNRGRLGILACRKIDDLQRLNSRLSDMASRGLGFIMILTDDDFLEMLRMKEQIQDGRIEEFMHLKFRKLLA